MTIAPRTLLLALLAGVLCGAEAEAPLAAWRSGAGSIGERPAAPGAPIAARETVVAGTEPIAIALGGIEGATAVLAPGSAVALDQERAGGRRLLVIELARGTVQVDIPTGAARDGVAVRGAALDVRVTGTLFVVERSGDQTDLVSLVRGRLLVNLRRELAEALGNPAGVELAGRQGVTGDRTKGLGQVQNLPPGMPALLLGASSDPAGLQAGELASQGDAGGAGAGGAGAGGVGAPGAGGGSAGQGAASAGSGMGPGGAGGGAGGLDDPEVAGLLDQLTVDLADQALGTVSDEVVQQILTTVQEDLADDLLAGPPSPPN